MAASQAASQAASRQVTKDGNTSVASIHSRQWPEADRSGGALQQELVYEAGEEQGEEVPAGDPGTDETALAYAAADATVLGYAAADGTVLGYEGAEEGGEEVLDEENTESELAVVAVDQTTLAPAVQPPAPILPFSPPESVQKWLHREDWEALSRAWADAEAQAIAWAEGEDDDLDEDELFWPDEEEESRSASLTSVTFSSSATSSVPRRPRQRPGWDQDFHLLGQDTRKPPPLRRYFDPAVPAEVSPPRQAVWRGNQRRQNSSRLESESLSTASSPSAREQWNDAWGARASTDNDRLHPHLRHYFDRRGLEASYRMRPHADHKWLQEQRPRTPGRPSTREKLLKWSASEPSLGSSESKSPGKGKSELNASLRGQGNIHWGTRCLMYGPDHQVRRSPTGDRIPWVYDHHISETADNEGINPMLRHYFNAEGIESSFRNRGRHYGRPKKMCFGMESLPQLPPVSPSKRSSEASSGRLSHGRGSGSVRS